MWLCLKVTTRCPYGFAPGVTETPEIAGVPYDQGLLTVGFPLIRHYYKPLFFFGDTLGEDRLTSYETSMEHGISHHVFRFVIYFDMISRVVVSNIFDFHPYLGKISNLTNIFQMGWNHQPVSHLVRLHFLFRTTWWLWGGCLGKSRSRSRTGQRRPCFGKNHYQMSSEKTPGYLGYIGDYTTQVYRDYNKPL